MIPGRARQLACHEIHSLRYLDRVGPGPAALAGAAAGCPRPASLSRTRMDSSYFALDGRLDILRISENPAKDYTVQRNLNVSE
jgi:hypothetical protein